VNQQQLLLMECLRCKAPVGKKSRTGPYPSRCDDCKAALEQEYRKLYYQQNVGVETSRSRAQNYKRYGLTPETYEAMLKRQDRKCLICFDELRTGRGGANIDHNHATGAVRGILCTLCNHLLGTARENLNILRAAIAYLEQHDEEST
jgi:hypothetical protein